MFIQHFASFFSCSYITPLISSSPLAIATVNENQAGCPEFRFSTDTASSGSNSELRKALQSVQVELQQKQRIELKKSLQARVKLLEKIHCPYLSQIDRETSTSSSSSAAAAQPTLQPVAKQVTFSPSTENLHKLPTVFGINFMKRFFLIFFFIFFSFFFRSENCIT